MQKTSKLTKDIHAFLKRKGKPVQMKEIVEHFNKKDLLLPNSRIWNAVHNNCEHNTGSPRFRRIMPKKPGQKSTFTVV
jgi:hypothetical protein